MNIEESLKLAPLTKKSIKINDKKITIKMKRMEIKRKKKILK